MPYDTLFQSFFMGGFESSNHRLRAGQRLDMIAATGHDRFAVQDYARLRRVGIAVARDAIRWPMIERKLGRYDFSSVLPVLRAAQQAGVQVVWDLCHYGWPDDIDIFSAEFVRRLAGLGRAFARFLAQESDDVPFLVPVNEISFWSWAGGEVAYLNPFVRGCGPDLKAQLSRAGIAAVEAVWEVTPEARIVWVDPIIHVTADPTRPDDRPAASRYTRSQFEGWDILSGRMWPEVGGAERYLDIVGVNYYFHNQWVYHNGRRIERGQRLYRPLHDILGDVYERYGRPVFVSETGTEAADRPEWLRYIVDEVVAARQAGVPVEAICWYPIVNHPGWDDSRHIHNGLWDYPSEIGEREIFEPLAQELARQRKRLEDEG
jgi:hypothetical protein